MDPLFSVPEIILNDREEPDCPQSGPLSLAGEPASPGSSTVTQTLQRRAKCLQRTANLLQMGAKHLQRRAKCLQRRAKRLQRRANPLQMGANPHQRADTQSSAGSRPPLDEEPAFEEPMTIIDTECPKENANEEGEEEDLEGKAIFEMLVKEYCAEECPKENANEEGEEEDLETGNASLLMYLDELCSDEDFVR